MEVPADYELKFHLFDGNEPDSSRYLAQYELIRDFRRDEGSVVSKVLSYFFEGLIALVGGDEKFWEGKNQDAYTFYQETIRMMNRFKNSRNSNERLDMLTERILLRANGMLKITDSLIARDRKLRKQFLTEALGNFNEEVNRSNQMNEQMSSYAAFARASFTQSHLLLLHANEIKQKDSDEAKRSLMQARHCIRQAGFIDSRYMYLNEEIEETLDNLTKNRLLIKAEVFANEATEVSERGEYLDAKVLFQKAVIYHKRASSLASDTGSRRKLLSSATRFEASINEAEANHLFRRDNNTVEAAIKYEEAGKLIDRAIALMGHFGSKKLVDSFTCQSDYYKAMGLQSKAITAFDQENYSDAKSFFSEASTLFKKAVVLGNSGDNSIVVSMSEEAIADVNGYVSMVEAML